MTDLTHRAACIKHFENELEKGLVHVSYATSGKQCTTDEIYSDINNFNKGVGAPIKERL